MYVTMFYKLIFVYITRQWIMHVYNQHKRSMLIYLTPNEIRGRAMSEHNIDLKASVESDSVHNRHNLPIYDSLCSHFQSRKSCLTDNCRRTLMKTNRRTLLLFTLNMHRYRTAEISLNGILAVCGKIWRRVTKVKTPEVLKLEQTWRVGLMEDEFILWSA